MPLPAAGHVRFVVPVGITGVQQIVVDAEFGPVCDGRTPVRLRGFGKEGLISRKPTRAVTAKAWTAVMSQTSS